MAASSDSWIERVFDRTLDRAIPLLMWFVLIALVAIAVFVVWALAT